jgi:metal-dependent amidase/aminoacylase/carboxypeptidase family protein
MKPSHPVLEAALSCHDWLVGLRQQLHRLPELSDREQATAERIKTELSARACLGKPWASTAWWPR